MFFKQTFPLYFRLVQYLINVLGSFVNKIKIHDYEIVITTTKENLLFLLTFFKKHSFCKFSTLSDIVVSDYPAFINRFAVQYLLLSMDFNMRIRVCVWTDEFTPLPSVCPLFSVANWYEREAWDMFGIFFTNHPDLRRILTDYGFRGHPLRKDFPLTGYLELFYDDTYKTLLYVPVSLAQDFRFFNYTQTWGS